MLLVSSGWQMPVSTGGLAAPQYKPFLAHQRLEEPVQGDQGCGKRGTTAWLLEPTSDRAYSSSFLHSSLPQARGMGRVPLTPMAFKFLEPITPPSPSAEWL